MDKGPLTREEIQSIEAETLAAFHDFCEKHDLCYFLCGGTLIGAVRHHGFIPWDDDVDTIMPRPDFMRLLSLAGDGMIDKHHKICSHYLDPDVPLVPYVIRIYDVRTRLVFSNMRIPCEIGCFVDVFAADGVPASAWERRAFFAKKKALTDLFFCCVAKFGYKRRTALVTALQYAALPLMPIIRIPGYRWYRDEADKMAEKYPYDECDYVAVVPGRGENEETMLKTELEPRVLLEFEGHWYYAMANYNEYLTNMYGDYMKLPPENERIAHHYFDAYWCGTEDGGVDTLAIILLLPCTFVVRPVRGGRRHG